ncbi:Protein M3 [Phlyctochytrium bullatum]|nr:Protein M3 [Phlyctochytrium bullatum]
MVALTGQIVWASTRPILKLIFIMLVGAYMSKRRTLTPEGSKMIATVLIWVLYPCLLFTKVVQGIDQSNLPQFGIMTAASLINLAIGLVVGYMVLRMTNPPVGFRYGAVLAVAMGNHGDLPIAIVLTLCELPPFKPGDSSKGVAYISGFLCLTNLFFFSIGYKLFGQDFRDRMALLPAPATSDSDASSDTAVEGRLTVSEDTPPTLAPATKAKEAEAEAGAAAGVGSGSASSTVVVVEGAEAAGGVVTDSVAVVGEVRKPGVWARAKRVAAGAGKRLRGLVAKEGRPIFSENTWFWIKSLANLANIATVVGLTVAVVPALKSLFQYTNPLTNASTSIKPTPSASEPPFLFLFEIFEFLGAAAIPFGLLNLGAALGRLSVRSLLPVRISLSIAFSRLVVLPVIGFGLVAALTTGGVLDSNDRVLRFILMIQAAVPTASSTVFLTQMWHPKGEADHIASVVLVQYCLAAFTMIASLAIALSMVS